MADLSRSLLKEFAKVTKGTIGTGEQTKYVRGTVKISGDKKYVLIDGASTTTPISEVVDVDEGDRVLVSIENHKATILGNFTFPPSARKEQEAIDKADNANNTANAAEQKAQDAKDNASNAMTNASNASNLAQEAVNSANQAIETANGVSQTATEAKKLASDAVADATQAKQDAAAAQSSVADANAEIARINGEVTNVKGDIAGALGDLAAQAEELTQVKTTLSLEYAKKTEVSEVEAELRTEITTQVGQLQTTISQNYAAKNDVVDMEGRLQSQITQNAENISSTVSSVEKLESDTTQAKKDVAEALTKAQEAQTAASSAQTTAAAAQTAADKAKTDAETAASAAATAQIKADQAAAAADTADKAVQQAQSDLNEAKQNLANVTNRVGATEQEIAEAQAAVNQAQQNVNQALADAATANAAANKAQAAADQAADDATQAQTAASNAQAKADQAKTVADKAQEDALKAQQDVAALTKRVTTAETKISQNSEQIELTASKTVEIGTKLDNLEIGGRNILLRTKDFAALESDSSTTHGGLQTGAKVQSEIYKGFTVRGSSSVPVNSSSLKYAEYMIKELNYGDIFTLSFYVKGTASNIRTYFYGPSGYVPARVIASSQNASVGGYADGNCDFKPSTEWTREWVTYEVSSDTSRDISLGKYLLIRSDGNTVTGANCYVCGLKFELGNTPTDWTPAPEDIENELVENYYSKEQTDSKILQTSESITSTVSKTYVTQATFNNLAIGGRNLFLNSGDLDKAFYGRVNTGTSGAYMVESYGSDDEVPSKNYKQYEIVGDPNNVFGPYFDGSNYYNSIKKGDLITVSVWQKLSRNTDVSMLLSVEFLESLTYIVRPKLTTEWQRIIVTGIATRDVSPGTSRIALTFYYNSNFKDGDIFYISSPKVEKGNKPTDWTPAPEDTDANIEEAQKTADEANSLAQSTETRVSISESEIQQLADSITSLVTDENGNSMMTQTSDGWTFNISEITKTLDDTAEKLNTTTEDLEETNSLIEGLKSDIAGLEDKTSYIIMTTDDTGAPCIELGKEGNPFKVRITNTSVDFIEGTTRVAYVDNQSLYIERAVIKNELQIGDGIGFIWKRRENGNLGLRWVGG